MIHINIAGQRFGRLFVLEFAGTSKRRLALWKCQCECGNVIVTAGKLLRSGESASCGCLRKERSSAAARVAKTIHGHTSGGNSRTYRIWANMVSRCTNPRFDSFRHYGARGISVCESWKTFSNFLEDMGPAPEGLTLDRIDGNGNYQASNCRWVTSKQQAENTSRTVWLEFDGQRLSMSEWSRRRGLQVQTVAARLKRGWSIERALCTPVSPA